jgi:hypothetical protein
MPIKAQSIVRSVACLLAMIAAGCGGAAKEESRIRTVEAKIDGLTCAACEPPLTAALRRQFGDAVEIDVDDERDTATVRLDAGQAFSAASFHQAAEQVRMRVMAFRLEICGRLEARGDERWLTAGASRFLVRGDSNLPLNQPLCLEGRVDAAREPLTLDVTSFELQRGTARGRTE